MKRKLFKQGGIIALSSLLLLSCNSDIDVKVDEELPNTIEETDTAKQESLSTIEYSVPTPNQLFDIIKHNGGVLNIDLINSLDNKDLYVTAKAKAINFGVYSADIGYMSAFEHGMEFLKYSKAIEAIGNDLGISDVFDQELLARIENNEGNTDSLFVISNDTYFNSYQYLEENDKGVELALIISGGFIESLYIVTNIAGEYSNDNEIFTKIGDQKLVLENIIDFCSTYMEDESINEIMSDLDEIGQVFEGNMDFIEEDSKLETENDILTISGGGHFVMNEKTFTAVKEKITEIRTKLTQK